MGTPEGWETDHIGNVCSNIIDCVNKTAPVVNFPTLYRMIRTTNVRHGKVDTKNVRFVDEATFKVWTRRGTLKPEDIILTREAPVGEVGWLINAEGMFLGQRTMMYRSNPHLMDQRFLYHLMMSHELKRQYDLLSAGGTVAHIRVPDCSKFIVPVPPLPEQKRIAEILSTWDRTIEVVEGLIENSQAQKKALMQQLLTGKKRLPGFSGEWENFDIKSMGKTSSGGTPSSDNEEYWNGEILWATPTDITALKEKYIKSTKRQITSKGLSSSSATLLSVGSLLICTRATIGYSAISIKPFCTNQGFKNLTPNSSFDVEFLYYLFQYFKHDFIRYACGSTFLELSKRDFEKRQFLTPKKEEQSAIADVLNVTDKEIETLSKKKQALKSEKSALMQQLLTGKRRAKIEKEIAV